MAATKQLSRREALKTLAAAAGAVSLANLPDCWQTPVIEAGTLPAHAQTSPTGRDFYRVTLVRQLTACENMGRHHIFVQVQDQNGSGLNGIPVKIHWADIADGYVVITTQAGSHFDGTVRDGVADFAMFKGSYFVSVMNAESEVAGPVTPDYGLNEFCNGSLGNSLYHVSFEIIFERTGK